MSKYYNLLHPVKSLLQRVRLLAEFNRAGPPLEKGEDSFTLLDQIHEIRPLVKGGQGISK
jgi:hypothetical protein